MLDDEDEDDDNGAGKVLEKATSRCGLGLRGARSVSKGFLERARSSSRWRWKRPILRLCNSSRCCAGRLMLKRMGLRTDGAEDVEAAGARDGGEDGIGSGEEGGEGDRVARKP